MYKVGITGSLAIRHALSGDFGEESRPHGHIYRIEWIFSARELGEDGFALDISLLEQARDSLLLRLDGAFLNEIPFFSGIQVSVENFARYALQELLGELEGLTPLSARLFKTELKVWENETAWASYSRNVPGL